MQGRAALRYFWIKKPRLPFRTAFGKLQFRDTFTTQNHEYKGIRRAASAAIFPLPTRGLKLWRGNEVLGGRPSARPFGRRNEGKPLLGHICKYVKKGCSVPPAVAER